MVGILSWVESMVGYKFQWLWVVVGGCFSDGFFFFLFKSVVRHKFRWLWVVVSGYFGGKYFWLG